ncbi:ubiquinol-cytochrome C chaperone-domain-containing protein [Pavlovales sp. CCMP2436]|nr:ubiquinol-cytochrome C chaperone-domain-containing protein [Pavlovales sp. CCMP2436]
MIIHMKCNKQARQPEFCAAYGVAPTYHATFQLAGLHVWMSHVRLRLEDPQRGNHVASELFEHWWHQTMVDMKEEGVHDFLQISSHLKELQNGFRGSAKAYDDALKDDDTIGVLRAALFRNVYFSEEGKQAEAVKLSGYVEQQLVQLMSMKSELFMSPEPGVWAFARPALSSDAGAAQPGLKGKANAGA